MQSISRVLEKYVAKEFTQKERAKIKLGAIANRWAEIVGKDAAGHCRPLELKGKMLYIGCESPVWANELSLMSEKVVSLVNEELGEKTVKKVVFRAV